MQWPLLESRKEKTEALSEIASRKSSSSPRYQRVYRYTYVFVEGTEARTGALVSNVMHPEISERLGCIQRGN